MKHPITSRWQICTTHCLPLAPCCLKEDGGVGRPGKMATGCLRGPGRQRTVPGLSGNGWLEQAARVGTEWRELRFAWLLQVMEELGSFRVVLHVASDVAATVSPIWFLTL